MDTRRGAMAVPKVRRVGFFTSIELSPETQRPNRSQSGPAEATSASPDSPSGNFISPILIPPSRHHSDNLTSRAAPVPVPGPSAFRRHLAHDRSLHVGSYNPVDSLLGTSPPSSNGELSEDSGSLFGFQRSDSTKLSSSFPNGGFDLTPAVRAPPQSEAQIAISSLSKGKNENTEVPGKSENASTKSQKGKEPKSLKEKTTKAERRAMQEAQRAAKAAAKGEGSGFADDSAKAKSSKSAKQPQTKKGRLPATLSVSEKKTVAAEKERRMDVPQTLMQYDDKSRVEKAKRRSVVEQTETKNKVELFLHLPQYERGNQLLNLSSNIFTLDTTIHLHHAVYKVGLQHLAGDISGDNARCIAMLQAFLEAIKDYSTPHMKDLTMDLTGKINGYVSFLIECRPLSMSMGNAIRFLKNQIRKLPVDLSESEAKASLCSDIGRFIDEKIILADKVIVQHAVTKIRDGEVLLTYGFSCVVEMILLYAHEIGKKFRVVIVDSRPNLEGQKLLRRLVIHGLDCTYTHINAISYIMPEATRVFLGASSIFSNGTLYSRVGTACIAMVAKAFSVPVIVCCEAYKFHERVLLDSICSNELGDPDAIANVPLRNNAKHSKTMDNNKNLQFLNLMYDSTPSEYISMIVTDYGMIPPTSIPVIVREYRRENLLL